MGKISKIYRALLTEFLSNADEYRIIFNPGLDLTSKILFIAAAIVIDIMVFDSDDNPCCACLPCLCSCACCCVSKKKKDLQEKIRRKSRDMGEANLLAGAAGAGMRL